MIKANSFEQIESKKIINRPIINKDQNKSYTEIDDYKLDENNNNKKNNLKQYKERNLLKNKKQYYYSYQMNNNFVEDKNKSVDNNINISNNANKKEIKSEIKNDKNNLNNEIDNIEDDEKKTIIDSYNRNLLVGYNQSGNIEGNKRKNFYLSPGIYNNNRKILKMLEMNKNNDKKYK